MAVLFNPEATEQAGGLVLPAFLSLTNPGAESGTTGWTSNYNGLFLADNFFTPPTGSFYFTVSSNQSSTRWGQTVDITSNLFTFVDGNSARVVVAAQRAGFTDVDSAQMNVVFLDGSDVYLGERFGPMTDPPGSGVFVLEEQTYDIPSGTRKIRLEIRGQRTTGTELSAYYDDFTMRIEAQPTPLSGFLPVYTKQDAVVIDWTFVSGTSGLISSANPPGGAIPGGYVALSGPDPGAANISHLDNTVVDSTALAQIALGNVTMHVTGLMVNTNNDDRIRIFANGLTGAGVVSGTTLETAVSPVDPNEVGIEFHLSGVLNSDVTQIRTGVDMTRFDGVTLDAAVCGLNAYLTWITESDPDFASVSLLLGFEGAADNATTFADESDTGTGVTFTGAGIAVDAAQAKYGTRSIDIVSNAYLAVPHNTNVSMANANDMTFEADVRCTDVTQINGIFNKRDSSSAEEFYLIINNTSFEVRSFISGSADVSLNGGTAVNDTWYHVALTREGNTWRLFVDGALLASADQTGQPSTNNAVLHIGNSAFNTGRWFRGNIDNVRITAGIARYTAAFTTLTKAHPSS